MLGLSCLPEKRSMLEPKSERRKVESEMQYVGSWDTAGDRWEAED